MFPSFYPPKKKGGATHSVVNSLDYVYGGLTSVGHERIMQPEFVAGVEREFLEVVGTDAESCLSCPVTIGSLNFEERVAKKIRGDVTESFFDFVYLGIDRPRRLNHAVGHEKRLKSSGLLSTDVHFTILNLLTDSARLFLPYVRVADSYGFYLWTELTNYKFGLSSPFDPQKRRISFPRIYGSDNEQIVELKRDIGALAADAFASGRLLGPRDVLDLLLSHRGVLSAKHDGKGVVIEHTTVSRPVRLNALIFSDAFHGDLVREKLAKLKRISREQCEAEFLRIAHARAQRQWARFGISRSWVAPRFGLQSDNYAQPEFISPAGLVWARALDLDAKYGSSIDRLGDACGRVSRRLGEIGEVLGDCIEDTEQVGGGRGSFEEAASGVRAAVAGAVAGGESLRRAIDSSRRTLEQPRGAGGCDRNLRQLAYKFHGAVHRVGRNLAGLPGTVKEVIEALGAFFRPANSKPKPQSAVWFADAARTFLHADIWAWLKFINPVDCDDVRETLELQRALKAQSGSERDGSRDVENSRRPDILKSPNRTVED